MSETPTGTEPKPTAAEAPKPKKKPSDFQKRYEAWRLKRRRARNTRKKTTGRGLTIVLTLVLIGLFAAFAASLNYLTPRSEGQELTIGELTALAEEKRIDTSVFKDEDNRLVGTFNAPVPEEPEEEPKKGEDSKGGKDAKGEQARGEGNDDAGRGNGNDNDARGTGGDAADEAAEEEEPSIAPPGSGQYWLSYPSSDAAFGVLSELVIGSGGEVTVDLQTSKTVVRAVSTYLLPLLILATFFGLLFSAGKGGGSAIGDVMSFGSIGKGKERKGGKGATTFDDVGGAEEAVAELREVVDYLTNPKRYDEIGAVPPKGVLLFGPPGCGKTLLAKAVAGEAGVPFFSVAGAEFVESLVGIGAARVRDLFSRVRAVAPAIVFIDELDAAGRKRGGGEGGGSDEREQTLNQMLVEMDGFEVSAGIVVIGATNRPDILDPALLRPGRFDRHITVDQPDQAGRKSILELHAKGKPMASSVDLNYIAKRTPGFSGADLANVVNEGALLTLREKKAEIETPELEEAIQRVLHGPKRRGRVLSDDERTRAAYHESGHAIVAAALGEAEDLHRVSILARTTGIGSTGISRESERLLLTRNQLYARVVSAMGGLAAEEVVLDEPSTGAEKDIEQATELARDIVGRFGMSPLLGRARLLASDVDQFLGGSSGFAHLSEQTHEEFDSEIRRLLNEAENEAIRILENNREALDAMATKLEELETLEGKLLDSLMAVVPPDTSGLSKAFANGSGNGVAPGTTPGTKKAVKGRTAG